VGLLGLLAVQPLPLRAQTIDTVIIRNENVFSVLDGAPEWMASLANGLHMRTRQWVIRRRLLLSRGDTLDIARMEESERALRGLGVFRAVRVDTVRVGRERKLALRALTADGWSTQPQVSFTSVGGDKTWELGFLERNFLGTATELALVYGRNPDRSRLDFDFLNPHFFSRRTLVALHYGNLSDGHRAGWRFGLPFHETAARHSIETYGEVAQDRLLRFRSDTLEKSQQHRLFRVGLGGGVALHATSRKYTRVWAGWEWRRENFADSGTTPFPYSVFTTVRAGIEFGSVRYRVLEHFNSYSRREDVDLSPTLWLGTVVESGIGYDVRGQTSAVWKRGFAVLRVSASGLDSTRTRARFTVVSQNIRRHTLIAHVEGGIVKGVKPGSEFDPWLEQSGPRLFGVHDFTGTRMNWIVFEDRILVIDDIAGLMAIGLAPFFDYGGAWYADQRARNGGNVGVSLRFGPTRAVRGEAAEIAFGYRFGDGVGSKRWALTLRKGIAF
jgi:hypothetical protein